MIKRKTGALEICLVAYFGGELGMSFCCLCIQVQGMSAFIFIDLRSCQKYLDPLLTAPDIVAF